ncbi:MAG: flagellar hook-basal body complex protein [Oscillospiraceae bacterium]|jgi:flagellar basal-body rod protein FlgG|nr:flagellar hook-basal body complex protein [Oscillospiraceae bacterium]
MIRGLYTAGTGMLLKRRQMETVINNITNADTTGYKKEYFISTPFSQVMVNRLNDSMPGTIGNMTFGAQPDQLYINFETGSFETTGSTTDFAIAGDAFFAVETPDGERYTKNGAYVLNSEGYLTDANGNYLLGTNGRIYVGSEDFAVDAQGRVTVGGAQTNQIRLVGFEDLNTLRKQGSNLFFSDEAPAELTGTVDIKQGFLETSNVDIAREMVDMMTVYRTYETNQRILTMIDETIGMSVNNIARLG